MRLFKPFFVTTIVTLAMRFRIFLFRAATRNTGIAAHYMRSCTWRATSYCPTKCVSACASTGCFAARRIVSPANAVMRDELNSRPVNFNMPQLLVGGGAAWQGSNSPTDEGLGWRRGGG